MNKSSEKKKPVFDVEQTDENKGKSIGFVAKILVAGVIVLCIYSFSLGIDNFLLTISISAMVAFTSSIVGAFIGFIFGIPRTPASKDPDNIAANTNLEEISDWITKIIVGVSLVQLNQLSGGIVELGNIISDGLGNQASSFVFSVSIMIFYFVGGFFLGYLWSRIYLPKILAASVKEGYLKKIENQLEETRTKLEETKTQQEEQAEIRNKVLEIVLQSDRKNPEDINSENFRKENLQKLIDNIKKHFDKPETGNLFGRVIASIYKLGHYEIINDLADQYKNEFDFIYGTWTDIALANLALYNSNRQQKYKERMQEAIDNTRRIIADYGVTYAIELYFELIDLTYAINVKNLKLESDAKENINRILNEIKSKPEVTAFETINYLSLNEDLSSWSVYNKMLREIFSKDYNEIIERSRKYKEANPNIAKFTGLES